MKRIHLIYYLRYLCVIVFLGTIIFFFLLNILIDNSLNIIRQEYANKGIYPNEIIKIQKKIDGQLGLYRGARKIIVLLSVISVLFSLTFYLETLTLEKR